jgi:hypothetical protein
LIVRIGFTPTHESIHHGNGLPRIRYGRVKIEYDDGSDDAFENVDRDKYFRWVTSGFDDRYQPAQITLRDEGDADEDNTDGLIWLEHLGLWWDPEEWNNLFL